VRLLFDENFDNDIFRGLRRRNPELELIRVQDVGLRTADDPVILEWAAQEGCILFTHDVETMTKYAYERVEAGLPMPGVVEIK
jgi:predicted nuclease of predicted toxin-antitoxin system